ncbi:MAG: hypothetical protein KAJ36_06625, partial [Candidatus Thorarchaeota archaeon]|nr:hypothetical protein [Candidatus Thorarchaeota archaeon]
GTYWGFLAAIIGKGTARAGEYLEKHYARNKSLSEAIEIALGALRVASETDLTADNVEIAKIPLETRKFQKLTRTEIEGYINPPKPGKKA